MNSLQETLIYLINHRLFASSPTAFGQLFAEKDRNRGIRIINGTTTNFDSTLQKFDEVFGLKEEDLHLWVKADQLASALHKLMGVEDAPKEEGYEVLKAIMQERYKKLPSDFKVHIADIKDLKCVRRKYYLAFLALFFLKMGGYRIYHKRFADDYLKVWKDLKDYLRMYDPTQDDLQNIADLYIKNEFYKEVCHESVWGIVEHLFPIFDVAEDPNRIEEHLRNYHLFDWGEDSYWVKRDEKFSIGESNFYWITRIDTQVSNKGIYHVVNIQCGENKEEFQMKAVYSLFFNEVNDFEGFRFIVYLTEIGTGKMMVGLANFDEKISLLHLNFDEEVGLPAELQMIDRVSPSGRENKVWKRIVDGFEEKAYDRIQLQYLNKVGDFELMDEAMDVVDVMVNRTSMVISVQDLCKEDMPITHYRISLDKHLFLKTLLPCDEIVMVRQNKDGKLYFWWTDRNIRLCVEEFEG